MMGLLSLSQWRGKEPAFADLLNFASVVDDGVVLNKDGSLMAGWFYQGSDIGSSTDEERNLVSARLNEALAKLGSGWMTHHDAIRFEAKGYPPPGASHFPDPISRLIDHERRIQFECEGAHFESFYALVVTYLPPLAATQKLARYMYDEASHDRARCQGSRVLESFNSRIAELEDTLSNVLRICRMRGERRVDEWGVEHINDQLLQYLNFAVTGDNHPVNLPPVPMYLDTVIGSREFWPGIIPKLGDKLIAVVAIDGFPLESTPGILSALDRLPICYRWNNRFIYLDPEDAKQQLGSYRRKWAQKTRGFLDQIMHTSRSGIDQDAVAMVDETESALADASSQLVLFGYYTSTVVLLSESRSELESASRLVRRTLQNLGFGCRIETINTNEAWLGTIPGHALPNLRRPLLHTIHLSDLLPTSSIWPGSDTAPCPLYSAGAPALLHAATEGSTPFRLNLHVGDVGHTLVFGPTGAGKSVLLAFIAAQFRRYQGASIYAFDKGRSLLALTSACGGQHYQISDEGNTSRFYPLADVDNDNEAAWAEGWLETCVGLQAGPSFVAPGHRNAIHNAVRLLARADRDMRTITNLVTNLQDQKLRQALEFYTVTGQAGDLLDNDRDSVGESSFQTFEIEELMNRGDKVAIPVLLYLFRRIERGLKGQPALLILDEAWLMLGHEVFRSKIREWLKVLRKANCAVVLATQSLSDAVRSGILDVLMESCPTKILLPNAEAGKGDESGTGPRTLYQLMGLNSRQIEIIASAIPKRQYYYLSPAGRRLVDLNLGPVAMSFVGASSKTDVSVIQQLRRSHGDRWPRAWLARRGIAVPEGSSTHE